MPPRPPPLLKLCSPLAALRRKHTRGRGGMSPRFTVNARINKLSPLRIQKSLVRPFDRCCFSQPSLIGRESRNPQISFLFCRVFCFLIFSTRKYPGAGRRRVQKLGFPSRFSLATRTQKYSKKSTQYFSFSTALLSSHEGTAAIRAATHSGVQPCESESCLT